MFDPETLTKAFEPIFLALEKYVQSNGCIHVKYQDTDYTIMFFPPKSHLPKEEVPLFRLPGESTGFSVRELNIWASQYEKETELEEMLRHASSVVQLLHVINAPSARDDNQELQSITSGLKNVAV